MKYKPAFGWLSISIQRYMLKNYFLIAIRNLFKNKSSSFINILGLVIGLCCCLLIGVYIKNELNYDRFEKNGDRIFRVIMEYSFDGGTASKKGNFTSMKVAPTLKKKFPEVENAVRMIKIPSVIRYKDKLLNEKKFMYVDSGVFKLFSLALLEGNPKTVLQAPHQLVVTKSTARRYFGDQDPIGKLVQVGSDSVPYLITGMTQDYPENSQIKFDFLASFTSLDMSEEQTYWDANYTTYLLLKDPASANKLEQKINGFMKKEMAGQGASIQFSLEAFKRVHLYSEYGGFEPNNNIKYIYILEGVTLLLLIIASFTYVNLNIARSVERAKEVGVRKVIGAGKGQLFWQFIGESTVLCLIAVVFSFVAAYFLLPFFNDLTAKELPASALFTYDIIIGALVLTILVSFLAGSYPSILLSNIIPSKVLKGSFKNTGSGKWIRKSLIVFQFFISVLLIASTFIMQKQLSFIQNKNLGYNRDQVLVLPLDQQMLAKLRVIKQEFRSGGNIYSISACARTPVDIQSGFNMRSSLMPPNQQIAVTADRVDDEFIKTTGLHLIAGADLSEQDIKDAEPPSGTNPLYHFILNESAARELGWSPELAIGKKMFLDESRPGYVKGVIKDFNFESMHQPIKSLVLFPEARANYLMLKLIGGNFLQTISFLESKWKTLVPDRPFEYHFLDDDFNSLYQSELRLGKVLNVFAGMAIALACLGLVGLSSYSAKQRQKEIGIRKVLGAGVRQMMALLSVEYVKLVIIAILLASPIAWIFMNQWLQDFAYHIQIYWWVFGITGSLVILIALFTVSLQVFNAAIANPVTSLRSE
jgi:putative ABC transport system permease protein